jgi:aspartyl-tRNA(Asn)/glutamyl-tRNA(Gln) amidotransferase subunit A
LDVASVEHPQEDYVGAMKQSVSGLRLGIPRAPFFDHLDDEIAHATENARPCWRNLLRAPRTFTCPHRVPSQKSSLEGEMEAFHMQLFRRDAGKYSLAPRRRRTLQKTMNVTRPAPVSPADLRERFGRAGTSPLLSLASFRMQPGKSWPFTLQFL